MKRFEMDDRIDISSYVETSSPRYLSKQPSPIRAINRSVVTSPGKSTVYRRQTVNSPSTNSRIWPLSARPDNLSAPIQQTKTERLLIEELSRLRTSFDDFRNDTKRRFDSILDTYSESMLSMMEDLVEVKGQLNAATNKIIELEGHIGRCKRNAKPQNEFRAPQDKGRSIISRDIHFNRSAAALISPIVKSSAIVREEFNLHSNQDVLNTTFTISDDENDKDPIVSQKRPSINSPANVLKPIHRKY